MIKKRQHSISSTCSLNILDEDRLQALITEGYTLQAAITLARIPAMLESKDENPGMSEQKAAI